ncbi:hypothetical protein Tco_1363226 [Tanacetum coccineum]
MGYTRRLAQLIRPRTTTSSSLASIIHPPTIPRTFEPLMKCYESTPSVNWKSYLQRYIRITKSYNLGREFSTGRVLGVSAVLGSFFLRPRFAHCMDGYASSVDDRSMDVFGKSEADDNPHNAMIFVKRLLVPIALLWLVWTHWDYPIFLGVKVLLALLTTKPSHYSVYVFIEQDSAAEAIQERASHLTQIQGQCFCTCYSTDLEKFVATSNHCKGNDTIFLMTNVPIIVQSLHAQKLEVEDYSVFCIAKVEIGEQKYTLLGIMGGWWVLQISFESALSGFKRRTLELLGTAGEDKEDTPRFICVSLDTIWEVGPRGGHLMKDKDDMWHAYLVTRIIYCDEKILIQWLPGHACPCWFLAWPGKVLPRRAVLVSLPRLGFVMCLLKVHGP